MELPLVDSGFAVPIFSPGIDPIDCLNKAMAFLIVVASSRFLSTNNQFRTSSNLRNQATIQDGIVTVQQVQKRQGQSYSGTRYKSNANSSGGNNSSGQTKVVKCYNCKIEDLDTYDFDCDEISNAKAVLMANISNYGSDIISEIMRYIVIAISFRTLTEDFEKRFTPQQELLAKQAFWLCMFDPTSKHSDALPVKIEAPKELPKISLSSVEKQCLEIAKKELLLENDRLLQQIMSQDVLLTVMNSMSFIGDTVNKDGNIKESCNLEAELLKSQNAFNNLLQSHSQLEKHCISLECSIQLNQEIFQKCESYDNQNALEIPEFFENNDLKAQLQDKDGTI
nr:hypothetical protein [Tanacetum cinerariifolium]